VAVVQGLRAIHLAVAALAMPEDDAPAGEPRYCRVELFGHGLVHGVVTDVWEYGRRWLEVIEPGFTIMPAHGEAGEPDRRHVERRRLYHPNAVYALEEVDQAEVMLGVLRRRGIQPARVPEAVALGLANEDIPF
jgi:hypothetical protein